MAQRTDTQALPAARPRRKWSPRARRDTINGLLFALPWMIGLALFWIYPILASFYYSFNDFNAIQNPKWVGLENYTNLFKDPEFLISAYNTFYFALLSIPLAIISAFGLALLLNMKIRGRFLYRTVYFLPTLVPSVALSLIWIQLFNPATGLVNLPGRRAGGAVPGRPARCAAGAL